MGEIKYDCFIPLDKVLIFFVTVGTMIVKDILIHPTVNVRVSACCLETAKIIWLKSLFQLST